MDNTSDMQQPNSSVIHPKPGKAQFVIPNKGGKGILLIDHAHKPVESITVRHAHALMGPQQSKIMWLLTTCYSI